MKREPMSRNESNGFKVSRRGFLALTGAGAAGLAVSGCGPHQLADFLEFTDGRSAPGGEEKWVTALCGQCDGGCSLRVRTIGGRAVNITGNTFYPLNRGGVCPAGLAALQALYNPDRVRGPLKRVGNRGEGKWQQISWEEAIQGAAQRLADIRGRGEPHTVVFLSGQPGGLMDAIISRFCRAYGTPNDIRKRSANLEAQALARYWMQGTRAPFTYDFENTNCIFSFGVPLLEASVSPVRMMRAYGYLRQERPGPKAKIFQVEPRCSVTAAKADEWVPIHPGTEAALALGIAYVLMREGLYDKQFVEQHTSGFDDWKDTDGKTHSGFRTLVLQEYNPDEVARLTGVPVATILRIAKEFGTRKPAIAVGETGSTNAMYSAMAVHALNALVGSIDVPGGVLFPDDVPLKPWPDFEPDAVARRGAMQPRVDRGSPLAFPFARDVVHALPAAVLAAEPYKVGALFLYATNPLFWSPESKRFAAAFAKIPFVVSFSPFLDESSVQADLILPDHTALERWDAAPAPPVIPYPLFAVGQPAVAPFCDSMQSADVLIRIARQLGGSMASAFPWADYPEALRYSVAGVYESRRGGIVERFTEKPWTTLLEQRGWWSPSYQNFDEFWAQLQDKGGWWDPVYSYGDWQRIFRTPSGKFEFHSLTLKKRFEELMPAHEANAESVLAALNLEARGDGVCLPHFEPPRFAGSAEQYPFYLNVVTLLPLPAGRSANQPFLQEILGPHVAMRWGSWVEINPATAEGLGVGDGDLVWLESPVGKIKVEAKLSPVAMPDVVNIPANLGHAAYGRWAKGIGVNPAQITAAEYDSLAGLNATAATRVKISKV
jgi:anaerobic selenocysteine-containing dehydrogenase